jgi:hypothetical protein
VAIIQVLGEAQILIINFLSGRSTIRLILENPSSFPVDFLRLSFQDSYSTSMRTYLAENDTTPGDAYEIESDLAFRPVFTYDESKLTSGIQPGQQISVDVRCLGKLGW